MGQHINLLELEDDILKHLATSKEPIKDKNGIEYVQETHRLESSSKGIHTFDIIISTINDKGEKIYFRFREMHYLVDERVYTKPFEVFKKTEVKEVITYSNYIKDEEEI